MENKKMQNKKEEYAQVTLRIPVGLKKGLRWQATIMGMSLNAFVLMIIRKVYPE